jgi:threonine dehydratase
MNRDYSLEPAKSQLKDMKPGINKFKETADNMGRIYSDIAWTIGNTPLVRLNYITKGLHADVLVKIESFNHMGSVKDRIELAMIEGT